MNFDERLIDFWKKEVEILSVQDKKEFLERDNCFAGAKKLEKFLRNNYGLVGNWTEVVKVGKSVSIGGEWKKKGNYIKVDVPDIRYENLSPADLRRMRELGYVNPRSNTQIAEYLKKANLEEEFCYIPHSWVEIRSKVLDPTGFYMDGKSGQFDEMVVDKTNLEDRYKYFRKPT